MSRVATLGEILAEYQKKFSVTEKQLRMCIREEVSKKKYKGKIIEFIFDRGHMDDMPRYYKLLYHLKKEDLDDRL